MPLIGQTDPDFATEGAALSALTLSALTLPMGSGYTKYREVMAEQGYLPHADELTTRTPERD